MSSYEAAAVVEKVGTGVTGFVAEDRVCYIDVSYGAYSQRRILQARRALRIPDSVTDEVAASLTIKGFTACMLLRRVHAVRAGEILLIHAAAGGVGQPLVRWAKHLGATVIATVGSEKKAAVARECGADYVILYREENFVERVAQITQGRGVDVAYDSVGADTFSGSIDCLGFLGTLVNFGQSSGPAPPLAISRLAARGSLEWCYPTDVVSLYPRPARPGGYGEGNLRRAGARGHPRADRTARATLRGTRSTHCFGSARDVGFGHFAAVVFRVYLSRCSPRATSDVALTCEFTCAIRGR